MRYKTIKRMMILTLASIFLSTITFQAAGDILIFKTGKTEEGIVDENRSNENQIFFIMVGGELTISRDRIKEIVKEPPDVSYIKLGDVFFKKGALGAALVYYQKAVVANRDNKEAQRKVELAKEELRKKEAEDEKVRIEEVGEMIEKARTMLENKKFSDARRTINEALIMKPTKEQLRDITRLSAELHYRWGELKLDRLNTTDAALEFQKVLEIEPENTRAREKLIEIWEKDPTKVDAIEKHYAEALARNPNDMATRLKMANLLFTQGKYEDALYEYEKVAEQGKMNPATFADKEKTILNILHRRAAENNYYDRAIEYFQTYLNRFPGADSTLLFKYQYRKKASEIKPDDVEARIELIRFCNANGLDTEAKTEIKTVLRQDPLNQEALALSQEYGEKEYEEALMFFEMGAYSSAIQRCKEIIREYAQIPSIVQKADILKMNAEREAKAEIANRKEKAENLAKKGDQYFQKAEYHRDAMKNTERNQSVYLFTDKRESIKYYARAIEFWKEALKIDPSLGNKDSMDLRTKLTDANYWYTKLTSPEAPEFWMRKQ